MKITNDIDTPCFTFSLIAINQTKPNQLNTTTTLVGFALIAHGLFAIVFPKFLAQSYPMMDKENMKEEINSSHIKKRGSMLFLFIFGGLFIFTLKIFV